MTLKIDNLHVHHHHVVWASHAPSKITAVASTRLLAAPTALFPTSTSTYPFINRIESLLSSALKPRQQSLPEPRLEPSSLFDLMPRSLPVAECAPATYPQGGLLPGVVAYARPPTWGPLSRFIYSFQSLPKCHLIHPMSKAYPALKIQLIPFPCFVFLPWQ